MYNPPLLLLLIALYSITGSYGLKCYTCSVTEDDADTSCDTDPESLGTGGITDCDKKYCIIVRVDYKDPRGKLASLTRSCVDKPTYTNDVIEDETHRAYFRSCKEDLCNSGSGKSESSGNNRALGDKSTIYCPGVGKDGATGLVVSVIMLTLGAIVSRLT